MKCYAMQKPKHKLSTAAKKKMRGIINEYVTLSTVVGAKKALEIVKENQKNEERVNTNDKDI